MQTDSPTPAARPHSERCPLSRQAYAELKPSYRSGHWKACPQVGKQLLIHLSEPGQPRSLGTRGSARLRLIIGSPLFHHKHGRPAHDDADAAAHGRLGNCRTRDAASCADTEEIRHRRPAARRPAHQPGGPQAPDVVPVGLSRLAAPSSRRARRHAEPGVLLEPVAAVAAAGPRVADAPQPAAAATQSRRPRGLFEPALRATITTAVAPALDAASDAAAVVAAGARAMIVAPP